MTDTIDEKVAHVRAAGQSRNHACHWTGCKTQVPPAKWGCARHWYRLPVALRTRIWRTYAIGQEAGRVSVSPEYVAAARDVEAWIAQQGGI